MPRTDDATSFIEEPATEEDMNNPNVPHYLEVDPNIDIVAIRLPMANALMETDKPLSSIGLFFIYLIYKKLHGKMPTVKQLTAMGAGSAPRIASIRKILIKYGFLKMYVVRKNGKIVAKHTYLTSPKLKNLNVRKHGGIIINNNIPPNSERTELGVCSSCNCSKKKQKTPKKFPREQDFDALWDVNRRKVNKEESRKAWRSKPVQSDLPSKDTLLEAYEADAESNKWDEAEQKYIPHLSSWLRGRCWRNHAGEPQGSNGGIHIMQQLKKSDGIESARQLRKEISEHYENTHTAPKLPKSLMRAYAKWLTGPDSLPATSKMSIKDVFINDAKNGGYWGAYMDAGMPGFKDIVTTKEF